MVNCCKLKGPKKALDKIKRMVLRGVAGCMVNLLWFPGHSGLVGNKKAEARLQIDQGLQGYLMQRGHTEVLPGRSDLKVARKKMELKICQEKKGMRQARLLIEEQLSKTWLVELRKFESHRLRLAVGWLVGHWRFNYHLSKLGLSRSVGCTWCHVEEETTEYLLWEYVAWAELRHEILESPRLEAGQLRELDLGSLILLVFFLNILLIFSKIR